MPTQQFISELGRLTVDEFLGAAIKYTREAGAEDIASMARVISDAVFSIVPPDDNSDEPPRLLKVADFLLEIGEPPPALVPDFLPSKKLICMSGAAKQGKSLVGLEFLHCVSVGGKLMNRFPVDHPGPVVYFGLEDGGPEIKERLLTRGITDIDNFYVCWQAFDMATPQGFETFKRLISELPLPPSLVIIDTAREAFRLRDWNDASVVGPVISPLRRWAQKYCTVILITHNNKDKFASGVNKIAGSGALPSSCDCYMILENQKVLPSGDLRWNWEMAGRGIKTTKYILEMDTNNLHVRVLIGGEIEAANQQDKQDDRKVWHERVANAIQESDEQQATVRQISIALDIKYDFARSLILEMTAHKNLLKTDATHQEGTGRPSPLYEVTSKGTYLLRVTAPVKTSQQVSPDDDIEDI